MERNKAITSEVAGSECPLLGLTKCIIFAIVTTFILYLPLGDPNDIQCDKRVGLGAMCCLCDFYSLLVKAVVRVYDVCRYILQSFLHVVYDTKLKFYSVLETFDGKDLCRYVCSEEWEEDVKNDKGDYKRTVGPACRCIKKRCCKRKI